MSPGVSVVIPVYNAKVHLTQLVGRLQRTLISIPGDFEILLVDDASPDGSWEMIGELARQYPKLRAIGFAKNAGQQRALLYGIERAVFDQIVTLDDDLEQPPESIPQLLRKLAEGFDVVIGVPSQRPRRWYRDVPARLAQFIFRSISRTGAPSSPFRVFRTELRNTFPPLESSVSSLDVLLDRCAQTVASVPVPFAKSARAATNQRWRIMVRYFINLIVGFLAPKHQSNRKLSPIVLRDDRPANL